MVKQKRKSAKMKAQLVLELLRGKLIEEVSRENQVTVADLSEWRTTFLQAGENGFKKHPEDSRIAEYERALGRAQIDLELYKKRELSECTQREFIETVKVEKSETMKEVFPMKRILAIAGLSSAAYYRKKPAGKEKVRRGPKPKISDEDLLVEIRAEILKSLFTDEGYKKIWKRMRKRGIKASGSRVNQLMRDNNLLSVTRPKPDRKVNEHTGIITTELPNRMWGTDGKKFYTLQERWWWFFGVIDHFNDEIMAWYSAKKGDRYAAMEPLRMAVIKTFGSLDRGVCLDIGLSLRTDHGSQYDSNDFQKELKFLGLVYSPAFVRSPECNGIIERFHRTINEQAFDKQVFESLEQDRLATAKFVEDYNREWLLHRLGLTSPLEYRKEFERGKNDAA